jgi:hypothetical protein
MAANNESQLTKTGNKRTITTAHRSSILAVLFMLFLSILAPDFAALIQSVNAQGNLYFEDEFNGSSLNSTKWNTQIATNGSRWCSATESNHLANLGQWLDASSKECNGVTQSPPYGNITVRNGLANFSSPELNRAFPYIWNGPSSSLPHLSSPFPDSGDFIFEISMRYNKISPFVGGVVLLERTDSNPAGSNPPFGPGQGVGIWAGPDGPRVDWRDQNFRSSSMFNSTAFHKYTLEYTNGSYSLYVDDVLMKQPTPSNTRPNTIWIGNPVIHHWGENDWTPFEIDYIRTYSLGRANMSAVH